MLPSLRDANSASEYPRSLASWLELDYFRRGRDRYFVPLAVKIPGSEIELARHGGAESTRLDFIGEIKDSKSAIVANVRDNIQVKLKGETSQQLAKTTLEYDTGFTLLPGKYMIKFLARDDETGRIGTYQTTFVIPNLNKEEKRIPISTVVLSSQRVPFSEALLNVQKTDAQKNTNADPLVFEGQRLFPSVTRVFSKQRDMYVFMQAYERGATATQPLVAFVTFYKGDVKALETALGRVMFESWLRAL